MPVLSSFRRGHSTHQALIRLIKNWKSCLDNSGIVCYILKNLSKAHDYIPYDLLNAKLNAYGGFTRNTAKLVYSYLTNRSQRVTEDPHIRPIDMHLLEFLRGQ